MSSPETKHILSAGLGRYAAIDAAAQARFGPDAGNTAKKLFESSVTQARAAGFEIISVDINPQDPEESLKRFTDELRSRSEWSGVNVGYGVRGHKEHTALFEKLLNVAWEVRPGVKVMFSNGPDEVVLAIKRNYPEAFGSG